MLPSGLRFAYELEIEITPALSLSAGELDNLILDGLFALDEQGILFPGVNTPSAGLRLIEAGIGAVGYARTGNAAPADEAYRRLMQRKGRVTKTSRQLEARLEEAAASLGAALLCQRNAGGEAGQPGRQVP